MSNYFMNNLISNSSKTFRDVFNKEGTDKAHRHGYEHVYSKLFYNKSIVRNILEIGIAYGSSNRSWKILYPNAKIFGIDNVEEFLINDDRSFSMFADQNNMDTFTEFRKNTEDISYDLIIDDASHIFELTYQTFIKTLPWMSDSGWYIIEDILKEDVIKWKNALLNFDNKYDIHYVDLNGLYPTEITDSFIIAISKKRNYEFGLISDALEKNDFNIIRDYFMNHEVLSNLGTDEFGRKLLGDSSEPILKEYSEKLIPIVRKFFNSETLLPSYSLFAEYSSKNIGLHKHKDANACTYTLDLVLYQKRPWGIFIDGVEFLAKPNEAVMFMGEKYEHWRETITDNNDKIGVIFFHYVEPDHWWFTHGPEYVDIIRKQKREGM